MRRLWLLGVSGAALWAAACSGNSSSVIPPPPNNGFTTSSLQGQYAFSMTGTDASGAATVPFARIGSFIADGKGGITGGAEDVNIFGSGTTEFAFTGGSYTVNTDGTGSLSLIDSSGTITFSITLTSASSGYMVDLPTDGLSAAGGDFVKQNASSFALSGISGPYAFDLSGVDSGGVAESVVGQIVANAGVLTGIADDNDGATINGGAGGGAAVVGHYQGPLNPADLSSFGRGQFAIGGINGVFYIVGPSQIKLMETTTGGTLLGDAFTQSNVPTTTGALSGSFVYVMGGAAGSSSGSVPLTRGGKFHTSGGALSSIIVDSSNAGQTSSLSTNSGSYTIDANGTGRGTISYQIQGQTHAFAYVFYLISPTRAFVQDQTFNVVEDGTMLAQGSSSITDSSLAGNYALTWSGVTSTNVGSGEEDLVGATSLASGALTGSIDLNEFASGGQGTKIPMTGTLKLSSDPTSHNSLTVNLATNPANNGITAFAYVAANNNVLLMTTQSVRVAVGVMTPQTP